MAARRNVKDVEFCSAGHGLYWTKWVLFVHAQIPLQAHAQTALSQGFPVLQSALNEICHKGPFLSQKGDRLL